MLEKKELEQIKSREKKLLDRHKAACADNLSLDMTRGLPSCEQLALSENLLSLPGLDIYKDELGKDCRNYGVLEGLQGARSLFSQILECDYENVIVGNNSSLSIMHDCIVRALLFGVPGGNQPWSQQGNIRFICPSPGYDRHFEITNHLGFELLSVDMTDEGPDMDRVEELASDFSVKGIWCVPRYSNPTGVTYSKEVSRRLANMKAAPDFRIFWDNAYAEHHLTEHPKPLPNILQACRKSGNPNRVLMFASTSKISMAGSGVAAMAASRENINDALSHLRYKTIGPDKINQLRHINFFKNIDGLRKHMAQHRKILRPKFDLVQEILERDLGGKKLATWSQPQGGYFISVNGPPGCARTIVELASEAGVKLTPAGAPFAYGLDPQNSVLRLAPTFPPIDEIRQAMDIFTLCLELAALQQQLL